VTHKEPLLPWQARNWPLLQAYRKQNRIPQALLVSGARGLGKRSLAREFAFSLLCEHPDESGFSCGICNSCLLLKAESHPDLSEISPEEDKKSISINQIRAVISDTALKPQYEKYRVILINPADLMTLSAINAFLKCLEEPGERTVFILLTSKPQRLPATVISRCQQIKLKFPDKQSVRDFLDSLESSGNTEHSINLAKYSIISLNQLTDNKLLKQREDSLADWISLAQQSSYPSIIAEKWQKIPEADLFNWIFSWISDLIKCRHECEASRLYNQDMAKFFQPLAEQIELPKLHNLSKLVLDGRAQLGGQVNQQLMLEEILIQWQQLNQDN